MKRSDKTIQEAIRIAKQNLRSCYTDRGILTGSRKVYWSWDSFFASFGALELGDFEIVKKNLELYLNLQNESGNIPKRIANPFYPLKFLHLPISEMPDKQKPNYSSPYYTGRSLSQGPTLIIAFYQYFDKTKDKDFLISNYSKLKKIISFLSSHTYESGLLRESIGGGWAESILKRGAIAYTNMCFAQSLLCMSKLSKKLGKAKDSTFYLNKYKLVRKVIDQRLWEERGGGYYSDWLGLSRHHYFSSDGNLFAVLWGIADRDKTSKIMRQVDILLSVSQPPLPLTLSRYYFWRIFITNQLAGLKHYHIRFSWPWLGCLAALAKLKTNDKKQAIQILNSIAKVIVCDQSVCETYNAGRPVKVFFYKSEKPWAWGAGFFLYACHKAGFKITR